MKWSICIEMDVRSTWRQVERERKKKYFWCSFRQRRSGVEKRVLEEKKKDGAGANENGPERDYPARVLEQEEREQIWGATSGFLDGIFDETQNAGREICKLSILIKRQMKT